MPDEPLGDQPQPTAPSPPPAPPHPSSPSPGNAPGSSLPPLLDYTGRRPQPEQETEQWGEVLRALVVVFGAIAILFFAWFGLCGLLGRGCG